MKVDRYPPTEREAPSRCDVTSERFSHDDVLLRHVSNTEVDHLQLALLLRIVGVQDGQERLHRAVHVTYGLERTQC